MNNKVLQRLIAVLTTLESNPQGLSAASLARMTGYPEGLILDDLNRVSLYTDLGNHFLLYPDDVEDNPEEDWENEDIDSPVNYLVKDPQVKWNLSITTDPYPTLGLTPREVMTLLWLFAEFPPPGNLKSLQDTLIKKLLPGKEIAAAKEMSEKLYTRGGVTFGETHYLDKLRSALLNELKVQLKYYAKNSEQEVNWLLWPLGLIFHTGNGTWYLAAKKEKTREIVLCSLDRVRGVEVLKEEFIYPEDFSLRHYLRLRWGMDMSRPETVRIRFYNEANVVEKVQREFKARGLPEPAQLEDGSLEYCGKIHGIKNFAKWVLSFGSSAEVLEPEWLRNEMIRIARGWCEQYGDK
ncbi:helix-turn-helix transcriptional regulator [Desulfolucanica intricata]|uniref:helix-turn-helix transcriptional regulator n=1 Tax=Desulfolucanica intricata TaxID=1285191 RepID=UPI000834E13E|nr:WYL domain-containing protein [Desulfolucanica intricata]